MVDVTLAPGVGHTVVIEGADPKARMLRVIDPNMASPGRRAIGYGAFSEIWNERAYGGSFRALVLTRPKAI